MHGWQVRDFVPEDLEDLVRLDDISTTTRQRPVFGLPDLVAALTGRQPAVVAVAEGRLIGSAVSRVEGDRAWLLRLALAPDWRGRGLGSALLSALEHRLMASGVRRLSAIGPPDETARGAMWRRHLDRTGDRVDLPVVVAASVNFTPADIGHAARTVAQKTFECTVDTGRRCHATTADYLQTIEAMRPTLTEEMVRDFHEDITAFART